MATPARGLRETVEFSLNVPEEIALKFPQGKIISTRVGERVLFSLTDERVMFADLATAQKINELGVRPGEKFCVVKKRKGSAPIEWDCWLHPDTEKARAAAEEAKHPEPPSQLEQQLAASIELAKRGKLGELGNGAFAIGKPEPQPAAPTPAPVATPAEDPLVAQANVLIDAFAVVLERALTMYGGKVKPDEVRAIFLTAAINYAKDGARR